MLPLQAPQQGNIVNSAWTLVSIEFEPKLGAPTARMDEVYGKFGGTIFLLAGPTSCLTVKARIGITQIRTVMAIVRSNGLMRRAATACYRNALHIPFTLTEISSPKPPVSKPYSGCLPAEPSRLPTQHGISHRPIQQLGIVITAS